MGKLLFWMGTVMVGVIAFKAGEHLFTKSETLYKKGL